MGLFNEQQACTPISVNQSKFNTSAILPYGLTIDHIFHSMQDFLEFLGFINIQLHTKDMPRLESFLMPANFSSMVGEFMTMTIPRYCHTIVKNKYHNGHPDMIPKDEFDGDAVQHASIGIEVKASRHIRGWQGHNPENIWLLVFVFDSNSSNDSRSTISAKPFKFIKVVGAQLNDTDWNFSGRSETSRRTITASINQVGFNKMESNWIYRDN